MASRINVDEITNTAQTKLVTLAELEEVVTKAVNGKAFATAWVNFDGTTTPPTIKDSFNVTSVDRISTGVFDITFAEPMDTLTYVWSYNTGGGVASEGVSGRTCVRALNKLTLDTRYSASATLTNHDDANLIFLGGKA